MSFRNRTTRFSPTQSEILSGGTPTRVTDSISRISAPTVAGLSFAGTTPRPTIRPTQSEILSGGTPTRVTRATRFTPRPPTPRPPTPTPTTRVSRPTQSEILSGGTPTRVTRARSVFRPPPRDDFQRSLTPLPVVREAFALPEPPRQIQERAVRVAGVPFAPARTVTKPVRDDVAIATSSFVPVSPPTKREEGIPFSLTGKPKTEVDILARQDPSFFLSVGQQRQAGISTAPLSADPTARAILGGFEQVTKGVSAFERERFEEQVLRPRGIDPRSPLGEGIGGFSEFSVGFSEEIFAQGSSIINLGSFVSDEVRRTGRVNIPFTDIGFDVGEPDPLVPPRRDLFVAPTVTAEFTGGLIEGALSGEDAFALGEKRARERIEAQSGIRSAGQVGGFVLPLAVGGASLIGTVVKAPRAFIATTGAKTIPIVKGGLKGGSIQTLTAKQLKFGNKIVKVQDKITKSTNAKEITKLNKQLDKLIAKTPKIDVTTKAGTIRQATISGFKEIEGVQPTQVARGITVFGRPIISQIAGEGRFGGIRAGAPQADDLTTFVRQIGSTPRTFPSLAEGSTRFAQKVNEQVVNKLVTTRNLSPELGEFFIQGGKTIRTATNAPDRIVRALGKQPFKFFTLAENKALKLFATKGGGKGITIKGSTAVRGQIREAGIRDIGDIDFVTNVFPDSVGLSNVKATELAKLLSKASGRNFEVGSGKQIGKVLLKEKGKQPKKVVEFLNRLDGEEGIAGGTNIVYGTKPVTKTLTIDGFKFTSIREEFRRKLASVASFQKAGAEGVPTDVGFGGRLGAPSGRFVKDPVDLFHEGKTIVATLRGLNTVDKLKRTIRFKGASKAEIDKFDNFLDTIPKRFVKDVDGVTINYNVVSPSTKQLLSFSRGFGSRTSSIGRASLKAGSKASKSLATSGQFSRLLSSSFFSGKPSKPSVRPSGVSLVPSGVISGNIFDPFSPSTTPSKPPSKPPSSFPPSSFPPPSFPPPPSSFPPPSTPPPSSFPPSIPRPPPTTPAVSSGLAGADPSGLFFPPQGQIRRRRLTSRERRSRLGGRLFDIADEPFGAVAVGLGFFVETQRGETSIEEALGVPDEPLTRQERQARARLGRNGGSRRRQNFAEGFDFGGFFG